MISWETMILSTLSSTMCFRLFTLAPHSLTRPQAQACSPKTAPWLAPHNALHIVARPKLVQNVGRLFLVIVSMYILSNKYYCLYLPLFYSKRFQAVKSDD